MAGPRSPITDDVDPAPRVLRIVANAIRAGFRAQNYGAPELDKVFHHFGETAHRRILRAAKILEGDTMKDEEAMSPLGRLLAAERRAPKKSRAKPKPPVTFRTKGRPDEERARQQLVDAGMLPDIPVPCP